MNEEKVRYGKHIVYLSFLTAKQYYDLGSPKANTVHGIPIKNDDVLFTVNQRGVDIIGGHIEEGETPHIALLREAMEEGSIIPTEYELIGAIKVDNRDCLKAAEKKGYPLIGYQLMYWLKEYKECEFRATHESTDRTYIPIKEIAFKHHSWTNTHEQVLNQCIKMKKKQEYKNLTKEEAFNILKANKEDFEFLSEKFRDDEDIVECAISLTFNDNLFQFASTRLKKNKTFILKMLSGMHTNEKYISALFIKHMSSSLKSDLEIATKALSKNGMALEYISKKLRYNKELCMIALKSNPYSHQYIPTKVLKDIDMLTLAVKFDGLALHRIPKQLRSNKELLITALKTAMFQGGSLLINTSEELKKDKEVLLVALKKDADNIRYIDKELIEKIGTNDPIQYLETLINYEKLNKNTISKNNISNNVIFKVKI